MVIRAISYKEKYVNSVRNSEGLSTKFCFLGRRSPPEAIGFLFFKVQIYQMQASHKN